MSVYPFIEAEKVQRRNVKRACELLKVSGAVYRSPADFENDHHGKVRNVA